MIRCLLLIVLALGVFSRWMPAAEPESTSSDPFAGVWLGEIVAPNARSVFGVAFTPTPQGLLVSVYFPEMFLYSANFGPADIRDGVFRFPPLALELTRHDDVLSGTFAPAKLPVQLHRGGTFSPAPPPPEYPAAPAPLWESRLGAGAWASPIVQDGIVLVGTVDGHFHALRAADGSTLWDWAGDSPIHAAACANADQVFFINDRGELISLRRTDGTLQWRTTLQHSNAPVAPAKDPTFNHRSPAPVLDARGSTIYAGSSDGGIYALKAATGRVLWRHDAHAPIYAALGLNGNQLVAGCFDGSVVVLDRATQKELLRAKPGGPIVSTPVSADGRWIVGARDYMLYGLDSKNGAVAWQNSYWFSWVESTPRLADGVLYIGGSDFRRVSALDPRTGRIRWSTDVRGLTWGTPAVSDHFVYAGTAGQNLAGTVIQHTGGLIALDRQSGAVKWRYSINGNTGDAFTGIAGSPVLDGTRLLAATVDGTLIAFAVE